MKTNRFFLILTVITLFAFSFESFSQFEQKFTFQASVGLIKPTGDMGEFFKTGISLDAGAQYNLNRSLSFVGLLKYGTLVPKDDFGGTLVDYKFNSIGISICPKYRFLTNSKLNPYILGGLGLSFTSMSWEDQKHKFPTSLGFMLGGGLDFSLNDNLALFFQTGYSSYKLSDDGYNSEINSIYFQFGVNISFLKSKSL